MCILHSPLQRSYLKGKPLERRFNYLHTCLQATLTGSELYHILVWINYQAYAMNCYTYVTGIYNEYNSLITRVLTVYNSVYIHFSENVKRPTEMLYILICQNCSESFQFPHLTVLSFCLYEKVYLEQEVCFRLY